ncbi:MAG TPA: CHAT domain-containing protein [Gemmatimonadales bacterium]|nr:CHAT domain-containing protein [Gemmatimonadales bacterium]
MRLLLIAGVALAALAAPVAAIQVGAGAREVVQSAERAVADDSAAVVAARWNQALRRDSADRVATLGLGTLARVTYEFETAERLFEGMLQGNRPGPDEWSVQARLGLYRVANAAGDMRRADSLAELALRDARLIGDGGGEMDALIGLSGTRSALGPEEPGLATLDTLRRLLPPGDGWERGEYLCRLGLLRGVVGDSAASTLIRDGIRMAERLGERQLAGHCLEAHALVFSLHARADSVFPIMDRAEELLRATRAHASLARLYSRRSDELQARGRLGEAKESLRKVIEEGTRSRNRQRMAYAYGGLGMLALRVGDLATAADWFDRAAALNDSLGRGEGALIARQNRAEVLAASGDLEAARAAFTGTLREAEEFGFFEDVVIAHQQLARLAIRQANWREAERQLTAADRKARARGLDGLAENLVYDRGVLALGRGGLAEAERLLGGFLARVAREDRLVRHTVRVRLAEVAARRGDLARAEREITAASRELEDWRESLSDDELRGYAFSATVLGEYDPQAPTARVLAALAAGGRVEAAFALAERRRARLLADRLNQAQALREGAALARAPAHRAGPLSAAEIVATLPDSSTAVVEYVAGGEGAPSTVFVLSRAGVRATVLPGADTLGPAIHRLVGLLEQGARPDGLAESLGKALLEPAAGLLPAGVTRLLVVPDGPLHRLPFDALRLAGGDPAVERWAIGLAPSASLAATLWRRGVDDSSTAPSRVLALGDPTFRTELASSGSRNAEVFRSAFAARGGLPRLEGSGEEARVVARYADGEAVVRLRDEASEAWLKQAPLERFGVIHLATHALVDERSLARTALALAPGGREDGFLSPADLADLELDADMVVLSACRTAGGVTVAGEGVQGLTTPLVAAGARSVVATQWRVGDRSTVRLVRDLYDALARGSPVADALRDAKLAALRRGAPPGEWAGFTVVGDPMTRVALAGPAKRPGAGAAGAAALIALVGGAAAYGAVRRRGRSGDRAVAPGTVAATHH